MNDIRRKLLKGAGSAAAVSVALAAGLLKMGLVNAAEIGNSTFGVLDFDSAMSAIGGLKAVASGDISLSAPDLSEDGAMVPVVVVSRIPMTDSIAIIVDKNAIPLVAKFDFKNGGIGSVTTRIKLAESSNVHAVVRAGGQIYKASKAVMVTIGGCEDYPSPMKSINDK